MVVGTPLLTSTAVMLYKHSGSALCRVCVTDNRKPKTDNHQNGVATKRSGSEAAPVGMNWSQTVKALPGLYSPSKAA